MRTLNVLKMIVITTMFLSLPVQAKEFGWLEDLSVEARADESGFRTRLATRFRIGDARVQAVIDNVGGRYSDAYMVLRLGEMTHMPVDTVIQHYHANKNRGWGALAKQLGIKPGSSDFHALKRGHDLYGGSNYKSSGKGKDKGKGKGNKCGGDGKGKGKNK